MKHVFGPVPSRRLGRSLGVDPVPLKTCNYSCVYCQLGRTRPLTSKRKAFFGVSAMFAEIATALDHQKSDSIDWITFVGSGETTLFSRLGSLIRFVKSIADVPVAVITNGSLLHLPEVRDELAVADAVLTSLDAGTEALHNRINRPHPDFTFDRCTKGLIEFRHEYDGRLWIEVMLLGGINESPRALGDIASILESVEPDGIHVSTPSRPPAEPWVEIPGRDVLQRAEAIFGGIARVLQPITVEVGNHVEEELADAILTVVSRHPMQEIEIVQTLAHWAPGQVHDALTNLAFQAKIKVIERYGKRFWCSTATLFPDQRTVARPRRMFTSRFDASDYFGLSDRQRGEDSKNRHRS